jgi:glycosyltransferase involved in cell wall biosynthesis
MTERPKISIIIPTYQEEEYIEATLKQFAGVTVPHELIVSDGGSTDKTLDIVRRYTQKIVIWDRATEGRRQTFGEAKNMGAAQAQGELLLFMDADVVLKNPQADLEKLIARFEKTPKLGALAVPLKVRKEFARPLDYIFIEPLNWWYLISNNVFNFATASGEFQMFRAELFKKVGGFNEHLVAGEDNDVFYRMSKVGFCTIYTGVYAYHSCRRPHKIGWLALYVMWIKNGLSVTFRNKAAYGEWKVVR